MAEVGVVMGAPAPDGRGTCTLSEPIEIPEEFVWKVLVNKVRHFYEYFRTSEHRCEELSDGWVHRVMVVDDEERLPKWGPHRFNENIKADKESGVVEFVDLDHETEKPTGKKRLNILHRNPLRIEYSSLSAEGVKTPLSNGNPIKQQIREAYEAWQKSLTDDARSAPNEGGSGGPDSTPTERTTKRPREEKVVVATEPTEEEGNADRNTGETEDAQPKRRKEGDLPKGPTEGSKNPPEKLKDEKKPAEPDPRRVPTQ